MTAGNNQTELPLTAIDAETLMEDCLEKLDILNSGVVDPEVLKQICGDASFLPKEAKVGSRRHNVYRRVCQRYYQEKICFLQRELAKHPGKDMSNVAPRFPES